MRLSCVQDKVGRVQLQELARTFKTTVGLYRSIWRSELWWFTVVGTNTAPQPDQADTSYTSYI